MGWEKANGENAHEEIVDGWGNWGENSKKRKATQWEHAGHVDNFVPVGNNNKGKEVSSCTSKGGKRSGNRLLAWQKKRDFGNGNGGCGQKGKGKSDFNNGNRDGGWKGEKGDFCDGNGGGGWKGKRAASNEIGGGWKGKRAVSNEIGGGWKGKRAVSNEIGCRSGKKTSSNVNGGSQVSNGGYRCGKLQTLGNNFHGLNGHRVSLHFPVQSPQLQRILREDLSLPPPAFGGFQNESRPRNYQCRRPRQVNGPPPPPTPPPVPVNAIQVYQPPVVQDKLLSRKVRVTHSQGGGWVMEVEEFH